MLCRLYGYARNWRGIMKKAASLWVFLLTTPALAAGEGISAYPASFFADARPATAYDMISRLPGYAAFQSIGVKQPKAPAISMAFVSGLANPDFLVEMDAIAVVPEG